MAGQDKKQTEKFQYGKSEVKKAKGKGTRAETKVTPAKRGAGKVSEAKKKTPKPRT